MDIVQRLIQNSEKHLRRSFFGKIANEYKPLANYICEKAPSWMFDRVFNIYIYEVYVILYISCYGSF